MESEFSPPLLFYRQLFRSRLPPTSLALLDPSHILHMPFTEPLSVKLSFSSASFTHSSDPAKTQTRVPHPKPTSISQTSVSPPKKLQPEHPCSHSSHSSKSPRQLLIIPPPLHHARYESGQQGSYLSRCIPQTGSSRPLSFHLNNACSNVVKRERSERASRHSGAVAQTPALSCSPSPSLSW